MMSTNKYQYFNYINFHITSFSKMVLNLPTVKLKFILEKIQYISFKYTQMSVSPKEEEGEGLDFHVTKILILYNRSLLKPAS